MKKTMQLLVVLLLPLVVYAQVNDLATDWPHWRGPTGNGYSPDGNPPVEWGPKKNIKWVLDIPGKGHATPIIWKGQLITVTAVETDKGGGQAEQPAAQARSWMKSLKSTKVNKFIVMSVDPETGKVQWQTTVHEEVPKESTHELGSWASGSPVTDGERIYAYFGSRGLFCLDMQGTVLWSRDFGQMSKRASFGEGSSAAVHKGRVFVLWDHEGDSFIYALDAKTGKDVWVNSRDERTSWASPRVEVVNGKPQVITAATKAVRAYDYDTGEIVWQCGGLTQNVIPSPVVDKGICYVMSGYRGEALLAIDLAKAKGDITGTDAVVWTLDSGTPYTPSPLLWGNYLYFLRANNGILSCVDIRTHELVYTGERLDGIGNVYSSPTGAGDQIYITGQKGVVYTVKAGPKFEVLAKNEFDDEFVSSPAVVGDLLYIRGYDKLYCIGR